MARYRHYKNFGVGGDTIFATTTCLDFAHLLARTEIKERMVERLWSDHLYYGAVLHAYVVMSNHIHFVSRVPPDKTYLGSSSGLNPTRLKNCYPC